MNHNGPEVDLQPRDRVTPRSRHLVLFFNQLMASVDRYLINLIQSNYSGIPLGLIGFQQISQRIIQGG